MFEMDKSNLSLLLINAQKTHKRKTKRKKRNQWNVIRMFFLRDWIHRENRLSNVSPRLNSLSLFTDEKNYIIFYVGRKSLIRLNIDLIERINSIKSIGSRTFGKRKTRRDEKRHRKKRMKNVDDNFECLSYCFFFSASVSQTVGR